MDYRRYLRLRGHTAHERATELNDEISAHIELRAEELMRRGESRERAYALARQRFGDVHAVQQSGRERDDRLRRRERLGDLRRDITVALRQARRSPGATVLTVATFALGIGLTTAVFTLVHGVLLKPLPFHEPHRLVTIQGMDSAGNAVAEVSYSNWADLHEQNTSLMSSALHLPQRVTVSTARSARYGSAQLVTVDYFDVLQVPMLVGRGITDGDAESNSAVVVSESFWRRQLAQQTVPGAQVRLNGQPFDVIGVVADERVYPEGTDFWIPLPPQERPGGIFRNFINWRAIGRLRDGISVAQAEAELSAIARRIQESEPESDYAYGAPVVPLRDVLVADARTYLQLLLGAVGFVLLVACANLTALNLARGTRRNGEVAVRYALGASRGRVLRQLVTEHLVLAAAGGTLGILVAYWTTAVAKRIAAAELPRLQDVTIDVRVLAFAIAITLVSGVLAGLAPAWRTSIASPRSLIGGRGIARGGRGIPGAALVVAEVAIAVLLLAGSGLLVRSFQSVLGRDVGFDPEGLAMAEITLDASRYGRDPTAFLPHWDRMLMAARGDGRTASAALANWVPTGNGGTGYLVVEGAGEDPRGAAYRVVSEGFFATMDIPILAGRDFNATDGVNAPRVAIISRRMAEQYWPGESALGRRIKAPGMEGPADQAPWLTIIGVVGDVRHDGHEDDAVAQQLYVSHRQRPDPWAWSLHLVVRDRSGDAGVAAETIRRVVTAIDPALPLEPARFDARLSELMRKRRLVMSLLSGFAAVGLVLAAIGIYGLLSFMVAQRTHELGIRAVLGARTDRIVRMVVRQSLLVVIPGLAVGLLLALWLTRLLESMLVGVSRTDLLTYALTLIVLLVVAVVAAFLPARRATRVDPLTALRAS